MGHTADAFDVDGNMNVDGTLTVDGASTLTGAITATGGVAGALTGNSAGTHTGAVVGNVTGNCTGASRQSFLFSIADAASAQTAVALVVHAGDAAITEIPMAYAGSVVAVAVRSEGACTSGSATCDVTIGGTATGLQAILESVTNDEQHQASQAPALDAFAIGGRIGVDLTTDATWAAGSTPSLLVTVTVEM